MAELIQEQFGVAARLVKGSSGSFNVKLGDELIFSKGKTGRFPDAGEVEASLAERLAS